MIDRRELVNPFEHFSLDESGCTGFVFLVAKNIVGTFVGILKSSN
jgi:hypothetical protein